MRVFASVLLLIVAVWSPLTEARARENTAVADLLYLIGYDTFMEGFSAALAGTNEQITAGDHSMAIAWDQAAREVFAPGDMLGEVISQMEGTLSPDEIDGALVFFNSRLGKLVTQMEVDAQVPEVQRRVDSEGKRILAELIETNADRLQSYTDMIAALGAIDSEVAAALNLNFAIYSGMSNSSKAAFQLSEAEILELVVSQQDLIRSTITDQIYITFSYTYRDLSDEDLDQYAAFLTSEAGQRLYAELQTATEQVLSVRARLFGARFVDLQGVQEL